MNISKCEYKEHRFLVCKNVLIYIILYSLVLKLDHLRLNNMHCYRYYNVS